GFHRNIIMVVGAFTICIFLGGIICGVIYWKYHRNALALLEIQKVQPTLYSYNVLKVATKDFHCDNKLGEGRFGVVYKGVLFDATELVVKLLTQKSHQGMDDFLNEVVSITNIRHKNLVTFKRNCLHGTQHLLMYEFVKNNNLVLALWDLQPCIIHRDIKASNILLNKTFNAKIADFGGYMSLEYATFCQLSTKLDVYSFGILLLEIVSGSKNMFDSTSKMEKNYLVKWKIRIILIMIFTLLINLICDSTYIASMASTQK
ncbi:hypothetical protein CY35_14G088700, partial [Sphagnum magellanicum]